MNIADRYTKGTSWGTWRDTHFKIIGKGVHGLQAAFLIDWYVVSKKLLNEKIYYPPLPVYSDDNIMQICTSGPVGQWRTLLQAAIFTVANAKKLCIYPDSLLPSDRRIEPSFADSGFRRRRRAVDASQAFGHTYGEHGRLTLSLMKW